MTPMLGMMMNMLRGRNPQMYNSISQAMNTGGDPQAILRQMMGNASPQQIQQVLSQAKNMGVPEDFLSKIQNLK